MKLDRLGRIAASGVMAMLGIVATVGLTACNATDRSAAGRGTGSSAVGAAGSSAGDAAETVEVPVGLSADGQALAMVGVDQTNLESEMAADADSSDQTGSSAGSSTAGSSTAGSAAGGSSSAPDRQRRRLRALALRRNVAHGQFTVDTRQGVKTVLVQRGTVQSISGSQLQVRSSDGFMLTWKIDDKSRFVADRQRADISRITAGIQVAIAGVEADGASTARLVVVPVHPAK